MADDFVSLEDAYRGEAAPAEPAPAQPQGSKKAASNFVSLEDVYGAPAAGERKGFGAAVTDSLKRGHQELVGSATELIPALYGAATGDDEMRDRNLAAYKKRMEAAPQPQVPSFTDISSPYDAGIYATEAVAGNAESMLPSLLLGGIGGLAAKKGVEIAVRKGIEGAAKAQVAGAITGAAERGATNSAAAAAVAEFTRKQAADKLATAATKGLTIGAGTGAGVGSAIQNVPESYQNLAEAGHPDAVGPALVAGAIKTALDVVPELRLIKNIFGEGAAEKILWKRVGKEAAKQFGYEGVTEAGQEVTDQAAESYIADKPFFTQANLVKVIDNFLQGGLSGAAAGALSSVRGPKHGENAAPPERQDANGSTPPGPTAQPPAPKAPTPADRLKQTIEAQPGNVEEQAGAVTSGKPVEQPPGIQTPTQAVNEANQQFEATSPVQPTQPASSTPAPAADPGEVKIEGAIQAAPGKPNREATEQDYQTVLTGLMAQHIAGQPISTSWVQRLTGLGYNKSAQIIQRLEAEGRISAPDRTGKRQVIPPAAADDDTAAPAPAPRDFVPVHEVYNSSGAVPQGRPAVRGPAFERPTAAPATSQPEQYDVTLKDGTTRRVTKDELDRIPLAQIDNYQPVAGGTHNAPVTQEQPQTSATPAELPTDGNKALRDIVAQLHATDPEANPEQYAALEQKARETADAIRGGDPLWNATGDQITPRVGMANRAEHIRRMENELAEIRAGRLNAGPERTKQLEAALPKHRDEYEAQRAKLKVGEALPAPAQGAPKSPFAQHWDHDLTPHGRRELATKAGFKGGEVERISKTAARHLDPRVEEVLERARDEAPAVASTGEVRDNTTPVESWPKPEKDGPKAPADKRLIILACSDRKRSFGKLAPALHVYDGEFFRQLRARTTDKDRPNIVILSAKHGFISADHLINHYDEKLTPERAKELATEENLAKGRELVRGNYDQVLVVAGEDYRPVIDHLRSALPEGALKERTQGSIMGQKAQLSRWLERNEPRTDGGKPLLPANDVSKLPDNKMPPKAKPGQAPNKLPKAGPGEMPRTRHGQGTPNDLWLPGAKGDVPKIAGIELHQKPDGRWQNAWYALLDSDKVGANRDFTGDFATREDALIDAAYKLGGFAVPNHKPGSELEGRRTNRIAGWLNDLAYHYPAIYKGLQEKPDKWKQIGTNPDGIPLFEDENGVRSTVKNGIRSTEKVGIVPGGGIRVDSIETKNTEYLTLDELNARRAKLGMPPWKSPAAAAEPEKHPGGQGMDPAKWQGAEIDKARQDRVLMTREGLGAYWQRQADNYRKVPLPDLAAAYGELARQMRDGEEFNPQRASEVAFGKPEAPAAPAPAPAAEKQREPALRLADRIALALKNGPISGKELQALAESVYGSKLSDGNFDRKDLYDALELGINKFIREHAEFFNPTVDGVDKAIARVKALRDLIDKLPTQTVRSEEQIKFQQFSTPPDYAFAVNWIANLKPGETVLEPSAGTGNIATPAMNAGARVVTNELSERRADLLRDLGPAQVFTENADHLNSILPADVKPTVVVMNPPFSQTAGRLGDKKVLTVGADHIEQALKRLQPGGRLVAIVGRGMAFGTPTFRPFWQRVSRDYHVRANVAVSGDVYTKNGTSFDTRVLVIDKVVWEGGTPITGEVANVEELVRKLEGVRNDRPVAEQPAAQPGGQGAAASGAGQPAGNLPVPPAADPMGSGNGAAAPGAGASGGPGTAGGKAPRPVRQPGTGNGVAGQQPAGGAGPGGAGSGPSTAAQPGSGEQPGGSGAGSNGVAGGSNAGGRAGGAAGVADAPLAVEQQAPASQGGGQLTEAVYETYQPQRLKIPGAQPHPGELVQSAAMASVLPPAPTYSPRISKQIVNSGGLSLAQLEAVVYAGQSHEKMLPAADGETPQRRGFFIGDGTGVGKGREISGIILDNWNQGRRKAVWISEKSSLFKDAQRDWSGIGQSKDALVNLGKTKLGTKLETPEGILFTTYDTLKTGIEDGKDKGPTFRKGQKVTVPANERALAGASSIVTAADDATHTGVIVGKAKGRAGVYEVQLEGVPENKFVHVNNITSAEEAKDKGRRLDQVVEWFGKDFDGVIVFDESHNLGNATEQESGGGRKKDASKKAAAGLALQRALPNARVVYVSATGATEVHNLAYAERLGLWGRGTAFATQRDFVSKVEEGGIAAMELVARDMKALGVYLARNLSYNGVEYDRVEHTLSTAQREIYDDLAHGWQIVLRNIGKALEVTGGDHKDAKKARSGIQSLFWGAHQRFFNQIITSMKMPSIIAGIERDVAEGRQAVLQLVNTNEAAQERALAKVENAAELEDLDMSPRDQLLQLVEKVFPTQQWEEYVDEETGATGSRPVVDSHGNPVHNPEAVAMRDALLERLGSLRVPDGPLEALFRHFGVDQVAEVTGRGQRVVVKPDEKTGQMRTVVEKRSASANIAEADAFQSGKKKILVFSDAGGTGRSYHADNTTASKNARRSHYLIQPGWRADKAIQGFGRTHRTNQASAPIFHLTTTDLPGERRFVSSIARRLAQLGALTKGQRQTGDQGIFSARDNLESQQAREALISFFNDLGRNKIDGITLKEFEAQTGLKLTDERTGGMSNATPEITQFLNRLLSLKIDAQNAVFSAFESRLDQAIERAQQAGTLDAGVETMKADKIEKISEQSVYSDPSSGAETHHVKLLVKNRNYPISFDEVSRGARGTAGKTPTAFVKAKNGRIYAVSEANNRTTVEGNVIPMLRLTHQLDSQYVEQSEFERRQKDGTYKPLDRGTAEREWNDAVAKTPEFRENDLHMVTGAILPIWDRLRGYPRVFRLQTDAGERLLGRIIANKDVAATLRALGATPDKVNVTPEQAVTRVMGGETAILANGWALTKRWVGGQPRIEVTRGTGEMSYSDIEQMRGDGVFSERIPGTYGSRHFVPTGERAAEVMRRITANRPIVEMRGGSATDDGMAARRQSEGATQNQALPADAEAQLRAELDKVGLRDVGVKLVDAISHGGQTADARFANGIIEVARDVAGGLPAMKSLVASHEAVHAMDALGLFTPGEIVARNAWADRVGIKQYGIAERYGDLTRDQQRQEAFAHYVQDYAEGRVRPIGLLARAMQKIGQLIEAVRNAITGRGFNTVADTAKRALSGEVGARERVGAPLSAVRARTESLTGTLLDGADPTLRWIGVEPRPVWANYAFLHGKHSDQFATPREVKGVVERVLSDPTDALPGTAPGHAIIAQRDTPRHRAIVLDLREKQGRYEVRSVHLMRPEQLDHKVEGARRRAATSRESGRPPMMADGTGQLPAPRDTVQPSKGNNGAGEGEGQAALRDRVRALAAAPRVQAAKAFTDAIVEDLQMIATPMAQGSDLARGAAKDFANATRAAEHSWNEVVELLKKAFPDRDRMAIMGRALDEESVMRQIGEAPAEGTGLSRLSAKERAAVLELDRMGKELWERAAEAGMVSGEAKPFYMPRGIVNVAEDGTLSRISKQARKGSSDGVGTNLFTSTPNLKRRKYLTPEETEQAAKDAFGDGATLISDIRALPLALRDFEKAIAGRELMNKVKAWGEAVGEDFVSASPRKGYFTIDHPAFYVLQPKLRKMDEPGPRGGTHEAVKDDQGKTIFERVPLYVRKDFEGPLRAVMTQREGAAYRALMDLKGRAMSAIMYSPMIHNGVIFGKALPLMPGKVITLKAYFEGNRVKNDAAYMREAIENGVVPIQRHGFKQDITSELQSDDTQPGRSWTAQVAGAAARPFGKAASDFVKRAVDKTGEVWHQTLLWDRVGDLQMGIHKTMFDEAMRKGMDRQTAMRVAGRIANQFAGTMANEAMSTLARRFSNLMLFSRTFTLGNLAIYKDAFRGLPKDVKAQIERDAGRVAATAASSFVRRHAMKALVVDLALLFVMNALLQNAFDYWWHNKSFDDITQGYVRRFHKLLNTYAQNPLEILNPIGAMEALSPTADNERGKERRIKVGHDANGTAIYARNVIGKVTEDLVDAVMSPFELVKKKLSTFARPMMQILQNDQGFGRHIYNPDDKTVSGMAKAAGNVVFYMLQNQIPAAAVEGTYDVFTKPGDRTIDALKLAGPMAGVTFSQGARGGEKVGLLNEQNREMQSRRMNEMPAINRAIDRGDIDTAINGMRSLGMNANEIRAHLKYRINPQARLAPEGRPMRNFTQHATPERRERMGE